MCDRCAAPSQVGIYVALDIWVHATFHTLRWAFQNNLNLLYGHVTGRSGVLSFLVCPLIVLPMAYPPLKKRMTYELRKGLHMSFALVFGISICFHAPMMQIS